MLSSTMLLGLEWWHGVCQASCTIFYAVRNAPGVSLFIMYCKKCVAICEAQNTFFSFVKAAHYVDCGLAQ